MLYNSFRALMMITSIMGILNMIVHSSYEYIFFPLTIIIWGIFSFFDENDREYLRRNGIDPDEVSWFFFFYSSYGYESRSNKEIKNGHYRYAAPARRESDHSAYQPQWGTYTPYAQSNVPSGYKYNDPTYKRLLPKVKRSFKITLDGKKDNSEKV